MICSEKPKVSIALKPRMSGSNSASFFFFKFLLRDFRNQTGEPWKKFFVVEIGVEAMVLRLVCCIRFLRIGFCFCFFCHIDSICLRVKIRLGKSFVKLGRASTKERSTNQQMNFDFSKNKNGRPKHLGNGRSWHEGNDRQNQRARITKSSDVICHPSQPIEHSNNFPPSATSN